MPLNPGSWALETEFPIIFTSHGILSFFYSFFSPPFQKQICGGLDLAHRPWGLPTPDGKERHGCPLQPQPLASSVTSGRWLTFSEPQLAHLQNGNKTASL